MIPHTRSKGVFSSQNKLSTADCALLKYVEFNFNFGKKLLEFDSRIHYFL